MNIYSVSSGENSPDNDSLNMVVTMSAGSRSSLKIYHSGGNTVLGYSTTSDYIPVIERRKSQNNEVRQLSASMSQQTGYPNFLTWIPGEQINPLSASTLVQTGQIPPLTPKQEISGGTVIKSGQIIMSDYYDDPWNPSGHMQIAQLAVPDSPFDSPTSPTGLKGSTARNTDLPFIVARNTDTASTGNFEIFSSTLEGCVFEMQLKRNFSNKRWDQTGAAQLPEKFGIISTDRLGRLAVLEEWNSIFSINKECNASSIFRSGESRDGLFTSEMISYLDQNWYGKLQTNLWGEAINKETVQLSTRNPEKLKNTIKYCFIYFGASDDIRALGVESYVNPWSYNGVGTLLKWHMSVGGLEPYSSQHRYLKRENTFLPSLNQYKNVTKVFGLPPKSAYTYNVSNNNNMVNSTGYIGE